MLHEDLNIYSSYLPYGVQLKLDKNVVWKPNSAEKPKVKGASATLTTALLDDIYKGVYDSIAKFQLVLRPLSDLTKEIEHNGEKFIPIIKTGGFIDDFESIKTVGLLRYYGYDFIQILLGWHFDIFGLIPQGKAIDINTLQNK